MLKGNVEDFYPLSPMQQGILFQAQYAPEADVYCGQMLCRLQGQLDQSAFEQAWQHAIDRHPILRTRFVWQGIKEPIQVVQQQAKIPIVQHDWRAISHDEQHTKLEFLRQRDRTQGFQLSEAPLMRLMLIQLAEDEYQFLWTYHHLLVDGWSLSLLFQEVIASYQASQNGQSLQFPRPRPYRDYIIWLQQQNLASASAFWRQQLQGVIAPTPFSVDRSIRASRDSKGSLCHRLDCAKQHIQLSTATTIALQTLAQQYQLTVNTVVQGAWALLLSRYSNESEVVFGVTSSGRPADLIGVESMVGLFINTLPFRVSVNPTATLIPWLHQLQIQQVEVRQYEYSPLVQVQQWSEVPPSVPLFESIVLFQNYPIDGSLGETLDRLTIQDVQTFEQTNYPITVLFVLGDVLELRVLYDRDRFEDSTITRMLGHLQTLLEGMVAHPDQPISTLPILTAPERHQLAAWNHSEANYTCNLCLHQLFEQQVEKTPDAIAVVYEGQSLTYQLLNQKANQLAHYLQQRGIQPDGLVGVCVERSLDMVIAILGILKAGGAYVPLDPAAPPERLSFILQDSQANLLVTQLSLLTQLADSDVHTICLDADQAAIAEAISTHPVSSASANHLAYVIYTSGSTGTPKGVLVSHANVTRLFAATKDWFQFNEQDVWTLFHSYAFDFSVWELWGALLHGGRLVVVPRSVTRSPDAFYHLLMQEGVTVLNQTPSAFRQLMRMEESNVAGQSLNLRYVIFGGEALELASLKPWCDRHGDRRPQLVNMYGITETTVHVTYRPITNADITSASGSLIGRAIPDLQLYLLDAHQQPVAIGVPGELYVGGAGVARGYLNRPEINAERFIPNPFSDSPQAQLYRSGDLARYLPNGDLEYLGRIDQQVKLRGFRIELGEIEVVLCQHSQVRDAIVLLHDGISSDPRLVAYFVPEANCPSPSELRDFLHQKLPDYMVPAAFVQLETLPLTMNGKVNRTALPAPDFSRSESAPSANSPCTPIAAALINIWTQVLGLEHIGIHENFFELGGHSLLAAQVIARVRESFQLEIPIRWLFEAPAIAPFAERIETQLRTKTGQPCSNIQPVARDQPLPLSFSQQRLWFLDQLEPGSAFYTIPAAVRLSGQLNVSALEQSFQALIDRHESLRTTFSTVEGQPVQIVHPTRNFQLRMIDLTDRSDPEAAMQTACLEEAQQPFDLNQDPLLRVALLKLAETEHGVLLTMHHIVSDGWSMGVLIQELAALYPAYAIGRSGSLPDLAIQYADFAAWQQHWLETVGETGQSPLQTQRDYWRQQLQGAPSLLPLPLDRPRPTLQTFRGAQQPIQLSRLLTTALNDLSRREGTTLFMTLLAAFNVLLHYYTRQDDILVGSPIANRNRAALENLIGFFVNTLVLRTDLSENPSFRVLLRRVREVTLGAYSHPDLPFEKLVEALQIERNLSYNPLFQVWFVLQNTPMPDLELPGLTMSAIEVDHGTARHDLKLNLWESSNGLEGCWMYKADLFHATTIQRMGELFEILLHHVTTQPDLSLSELLQLLSDCDRDHQQQHLSELEIASSQKLKLTRRKVIRS